MHPLSKPPTFDLEARAQAFAQSAHAGQTYSDGTYFDRHLTRVVAVLRRFGEIAPATLAAAWLHDVIEDTPTTRDTLRQQFGEDVAELVWRLTDEPGNTRRQRHEKTYPKIRHSPGAVRIKLADRIANVEASCEQKSSLLDMYRKEHATFRAHLHQPGEYDDMWASLDALLMIVRL